MREKILKIKQEYPTWGYQKIADAVGCAKNTAKYYLHPDEAQKSKNRVRRNRVTLNGVLKRKKDHFQMIGEKTFYGKTKRSKRVPSSFSARELKEKLTSNPVCYLTGQKIDLLEPKSYELDHITPKSKGGDNSLSNCGLASRNANRSKADMTLEEYLSLCKRVLEYNGFRVSDKLIHQ
jgi:CRISPR/Cas system Type II protein with McrA/HNH and RuvC-like nuclease domain